MQDGMMHDCTWQMTSLWCRKYFESLKIKFSKSHLRVSVFWAVFMLPMAAGWHRSGDATEMTPRVWDFWSTDAAFAEWNSISVQMFVRAVLPSRSGALTPNLQKHRTPSASWVNKPTNKRYTWIICFPHKPFQWDIILLFWAFNLLFVHPQASSGSSGTVFSLAPFPALHIRSVVNHGNLLASFCQSSLLVLR